MGRGAALWAVAILALLACPAAAKDRKYKQGQEVSIWANKGERRRAARAVLPRAVCADHTASGGGGGATCSQSLTPVLPACPHAPCSCSWTICQPHVSATGRAACWSGLPRPITGPGPLLLHRLHCCHCRSLWGLRIALVATCTPSPSCVLVLPRSCHPPRSETYQYFNLPFCHPKEGKEYKTEGLGEVLEGDRLVSTPYKLK